MWDQFGPGAVGIGWDMALLGLALHLATGKNAPEEVGPDWSTTDEGKEFTRQSGEAWREAHVESGADEAVARACADRTIGAYTGEAE